MINPNQLNRPDVTAEVAGAFRAYESALAAGDTVVLNEAFWPSPHTVRFGITDRQHGGEDIARWRRTQGPLPGRKLDITQVMTFGADTAVVTTLFSYPGQPFEGRQSQTWIRFGEGWRIVSAHVSETPRLDDSSHG